MTRTTQPIATFSHSHAGNFALWLDEIPLQIDDTAIAYYFQSATDSVGVVIYLQNYTKLSDKPWHLDGYISATPNFRQLCDAIGSLLAQA